ncbi:2-oxogluatarate-iron(II)-dependent oxygenase [Selaginella moellendorffii]|uniref:2-oxogluatarate-iron(II)-dependent oxygenase n=1 Tax=Selaginella moellendorffii TaxID=88036 RepID=D8R5S1_SELML|nr:S-norcoclaurine synthase 1 [Selaginella moellendorffii]EFJ32202.1 2-oxogluatarate-iron(II)-dependent oxygenase [Selaginella moellendorffii]|eukprot:XP_002966175.1 S-norcoclaurine synthase 1 [Selaginella moellendorffii]
MAEDFSIPLIDLAPLHQAGNAPRVEVLEKISKACEEWGFFQVINHGLDLKLLSKVLHNCKEFFSLPEEEKTKMETSHPPVGYVNKSGVGGMVDRKEHFFAHVSDNPASNNVWPENPSTFRPTAENLILEARKTASFLVQIMSESLGLPNEQRLEMYKAGDALIMLKYPACPEGYEGPVLAKHRDGDILTIVAQLNNAQGLEVLHEKDQQEIWVPVKPVENALVINVGDVLQVWSNGRYKSVLHRVSGSQMDRYSFAYFHMPVPTTQISPLDAFTAHEIPKYRPFMHGEYLQLRYENKKLDSKNAKEITIDYYAM